MRIYKKKIINKNRSLQAFNKILIIKILDSNNYKNNYMKLNNKLLAYPLTTNNLKNNLTTSNKNLPPMKILIKI